MSVTIVTQTCVRPESGEAFARWQGETSKLVAALPGFIEQRLVPPKPPLQVDWVILQRFATREDAQRWLESPERQRRLEDAAPMLVGRDDVHLVEDDRDGSGPAPVSAVISTRVRTGKEAAYRAWVRRIAAAQARAPGMKGYRFEPPVPGVQDDFIAILRFDSEQNLQAWLDSPERNRLLAEAAPLTEESHTRLARTGFEQWFREDPAAPPPATWKFNMVVLLLLYPIVFLFADLVQTPLLVDRLGLPFPVALFVGNIVSVTLIALLAPRASVLLAWWLQPAKGPSRRTDLLGVALLLAIYALLVIAFWRLF